MNRMVNNIQLAWILRTYRTCNSMVGFSNYDFYYKLLVGVILLKVISGETWTQPILKLLIKLFMTSLVGS